MASAVPRGPYLETRLEWNAALFARFSSNAVLTFLFPDSEVCRRVLVSEADVSYAPTGLLGTVHAGEDACQAAGIANLVEWRDRRPRGPLPRQAIPRAQASYRILGQDEAVAFALGRFPLAWRVGWSAGDRVVALLPRSPECDPLIAQGVASLEFRPAGPNALALVAERGLCPLQGLALPQDTPAATE